MALTQDPSENLSVDRHCPTGEQSVMVPRHGPATLLEAYRDRCRQQYARYFEGLTEHYSIEQRWPASPFWQRRHRPVSLASA